MYLRLSSVFAWPRSPVPLPPAGMIFCAVAFQPIAGSVELGLSGFAHVQLLLVPRLVSVSLRSKQYSHFASGLAVPIGVYGMVAGPGVVGSVAVSRATGI